MWAALLEWRNTVTPTMKSSPVQRLMSRRTRSFLPCASSQYNPTVQEKVTHKIVEKRRTAKYYHDKGSKVLPKLVVGQPVRVKTPPHRLHSGWTPGQVVRGAAPRSFVVEVHGRQYRRNRVHIRDTLVPPRAREHSPSPVNTAENSSAKETATATSTPTSGNEALTPTPTPTPSSEIHTPRSETHVPGNKAPRASKVSGQSDKVTSDTAVRVCKYERVINTPAKFKDTV